MRTTYPVSDHHLSPNPNTYPAELPTSRVTALTITSAGPPAHRVSSIESATMEAAWPAITAVIGVGVGLAGLIWQLQRETSKRIENLEFRTQSVETGLAEL